MNATLQRDYMAARRDGWHARQAFALAKAQRMLREHNGDVRVRVETDDEPFDIGDMFTAAGLPDVPKAKREKMEREFLERMYNAGGPWGFVVEYRMPESEEWVHVDSCWGFDDAEYCEKEGMLYVPGAVAALEAARANVCPTCGGSGKRSR